MATVEQQDLSAITQADEPDWRRLQATTSKVFRPTAPVSVLDMLSGREPQITKICDVIMQPGQHAILYGERGVGKTSLANVLSEYLQLAEEEDDGTETLGPIISPRVNCDGNDVFDSVWRKIFGSISLSQNHKPIGFGAKETQQFSTALSLLGPRFQAGAKRAKKMDQDAVRQVLVTLGKNSLPILIVDEFDRMSEKPRKAFADLIKMLSDHEVPATVVLVGVAESVDGLLQDHESVGRALVQVNMPRMTPDEIQKILTAGTEKLGMTIDRETVRRISAISGGLPHYAHLLGLHSARAALKDETLEIAKKHVRVAVKRATEDAQQSVTRAYYEAVRSSQKGNLFADVLLACAMANCDELGYFKAQDVREPMRQITGKLYDIPNFAKHLSDFTTKRGPILQIIGEVRRRSYHFHDPLMQPFVLMQGEVSGRLPERFFADNGLTAHRKRLGFSVSSYT